MPAGLQIFNDTGTVQIDENWKNYRFRQKIPITLSWTIPSLDTINRYTLVVAGEGVMVACKASVLFPYMPVSYFDGTNYYFQWTFLPPPVAGSFSETVEFYVFDTPDVGASSNVGMEIRNASGQIVFHSDMKPMKVAGFLSAASTFTGTPGRSYVPLIATQPFRTEPFGSGRRIYARTLQTFGHQIIPNSQLTEYGALGTWDAGGTYAAIDVTGL